MLKDERATYVTREQDVLDALGGPGGPTTLSQLSDFFAPCLEPGHGPERNGTCLIVGDTPSDRLMFWNLHNCFGGQFPPQMTTLRLPSAGAEDEEFVGRVKKIIFRRGASSLNGHNDHINLYSCSLPQEELEALSARLRQGKEWLGISVNRHADHAALVPRFRDAELVRFSTGGAFSDFSARASAEFQGNRAPVPLVTPWHLKEALPPAALRSGNWVIDLAIDRQADHCKYSNVRHTWRLPRRLRLERAFALEREGPKSFDVDGDLIRNVRPGLLGVAVSLSVTRASLGLPDDFDAFRLGLCNRWEWSPFDRFRDEAPHGRQRFAAATYSDKGRYLTGILQLFKTVPDAFAFLMNGFWRETLHHLGAASTETNEEKANEFLLMLRRRIGPKTGPLSFASDEQLGRLASEALRAGRMLSREVRYIGFDQLQNRWQAAAEAFIVAHPSSGEDDPDAYIRDRRHLEGSLQFLCQRELLFQGREWRCPSCNNRNWVGIDAVSRTLVCAVCGRDEPAPVAGNWQFRLNPFVLEAYRDHGTEAAIWALWRLSERAQFSFYFVPSLKLWLVYPETLSDNCDVEVDAVAVVDGAVYLVEAKSSGGLTDREMNQLLLATERIRPDVLLIASMEGGGPAIERAANKLRAALPDNIKVEALLFEPAALDRSPFLPS